MRQGEGNKLGGGGGGNSHHTGDSGGLSKEDMRQRRLAALSSKSKPSSGVNNGNSNSDNTAAANPSISNPRNQKQSQTTATTTAEARSAPSAVPQSDAVAPTTPPKTKAESNSTASSSVESFDIRSFHRIMWDDSLTTQNDKKRWVDQGIEMSHTREKDPPPPSSPSANTDLLEFMGSSHAPWGLTQTHGGPCGTLAAVQAELLRILLHGPRNPLRYPTQLQDGHPQTAAAAASLTPDLVCEALNMAIAMIIARTAVMPPAVDMEQKASLVAKVVLPKSATQEGSQTTSTAPLEWSDFGPWSPAPEGASAPSETFQAHRITIDGAIPQSRDDQMVALAQKVALFLKTHLSCFQAPGGVLMIVMSLVATRPNLQNDMDLSTELTSQFGHCSQELINLLLTGMAVSNVFDNTMTPSGGFTCRGILLRPTVGYLSQLEALRYVQVGGYYKQPRFPVWIVGSTSHFTVVFGGPESLKESASDALLERCRRAFRQIDTDENGFISRLDLQKVLDLLDLAYTSHQIQTLAATLEVGGADIILWDDFWKATSRLMTGASLETVLQGTSPIPTTIAATATAATAPVGAKVETDEEMARRLAAEWSSAPAATTAPAVTSYTGIVDATPAVAAGQMTDEELARKLQAEWDGTANATNNSHSIHDDDNQTQRAVADEVIEIQDDGTDVKMAESAAAAAAAGTGQQRMDFETFGDTFVLYHYNGLRGGNLTPFRVTRLTDEEAVGASIAMSQGNAAGIMLGGGGSEGDLESVVRTKWPSCQIDWMGKQSPYID